MTAHELTELVRLEVKQLLDAQKKFLHTYQLLCARHGGPDWHKEQREMVFHHVRKEIIPIMEHAGMDHAAVQALCAWAEKLVKK